VVERQVPEAQTDRLSRKDKLELVVSLAALGLTVAAVVLSLKAFQQAEDADERSIRSAEQSLADKVLFQADSSTDPALHTEDITSWRFSVSNYGSLPIDLPHIQFNLPVVDQNGEEVSLQGVLVIGRVMDPCSEAVAVYESKLSDPTVVFTDANGRTWARQEGEEPVRADAGDLFQTEDVDWQINPLACSGLQ
jgi:hypothetical protein